MRRVLKRYCSPTLLIVIVNLLIGNNAASNDAENDEEIYLAPHHHRESGAGGREKVESLARVLRDSLTRLRSTTRSELVFLVDASSSVGDVNFEDEIRFVRKLLADFTVAPDAARVAVVTFASKRLVVRHVDQLRDAERKCRLMREQLPAITYTGGGTYTLGAMLEAQDIMTLSRPDAIRAVFLVTDGYSNGGDPVPAAIQLHQQGVELFTFGIRNGNVKELLSMASTETHAFILDSFEEFEALARRALHRDLPEGDYEYENSTSCDFICGHEECCPFPAQCACGTHTGQYTCVCPAGYYESGLTGQCTPCPPGTYRPHSGPGDESSCYTCPDLQHVSPAASTSATQCVCPLGFVARHSRCVDKECEVLSQPENGYFVNGNCSNAANAACGIRCNSGFTLKGNSIHVCQPNGTWSGDPASCEVKRCAPLKAPRYGLMECSRDDRTTDTECRFKCNFGYALVGSKRRTCLPLALWDGLPALCKPVLCPSLNLPPRVVVEPRRCATSRLPVASECRFSCTDDFRLQTGPGEVTCGPLGTWDANTRNLKCHDFVPPTIQCPPDATIETDDGYPWATVVWDSPNATDNSGNVSSIKLLFHSEDKSRLSIGRHQLTYVATDDEENMANCSFQVTVVDRETPRVEQCDNPPIFVSDNPDMELTWDEPVFSDNSNETLNITRRPDTSVFPYGSTVITYEAVDSSGNRNTCNVTLRMQKHVCEIPAGSPHATFNCTHLSDDLMCSLICEDGYAYAFAEEAKYYCSAKESFQIAHETNDRNLACSVIVIPRQTWQGGLVALEGTDKSVCREEKSLHRVAAKVERFLVSQVDEHCPANLKCNVVETSATCEHLRYDVNRRRRKRRALDTVNINVKFRLRGRLKLPQGQDAEVIAKGLTSVAENILEKISFAQISVDGDRPQQLLKVKKAEFEADLEVDCWIGGVARNGKCVLCPRGTFFESNKCARCPKGSYQPREGQLRCLQCPVGTSTSDKGSRAVSDCKVLCPPGSVSRDGLLPCSTCKKGFFQSRLGERKCHMCSTGTSTWRRGSTRKDDCLEVCRVNTVSPTGLAPCFPCPENFFQPKLGQTFCFSCSPEMTPCENITAVDLQTLHREPVDSCFSNPCQNNAICRSIAMSFYCICAPGYTGALCENELRPCSSSPCHFESTCIDLQGTYKCLCPPGLAGNTCQEDIDECRTKPCRNGATCVNGDGNFLCICDEGWTGALCDVNIDDCYGHYCQNNATCMDGHNAYSCICDDGYSGKLCEIADVNNECEISSTGHSCLEIEDECKMSPCKSGATCVLVYGRPQCLCPSGFTGRFCETDLPSNFSLLFPNPRSRLDYVRIKNFRRPLSQITLCFWVRSADRQHYGTPFSFATKDHDNAFTLTDTNGFVLYVLGERVVTDVTACDGKWHFVCALWDSKFGQWAVYRDGVKEADGKGLAAEQILPDEGVLVVGQEQDRPGGGFSFPEAFVGQLAHLNVWDSILAEEEIKQISQSCLPGRGSVLAWADLLGGIVGGVMVEEGSPLCRECASPPAPPQGFVEVIDGVASYACRPGFRLNGPEKRRCLPQGHWEEDEPVCTRLSCGPPTRLSNGVVTGTGYYFGDRVKFECNPGYNLVGSRERECVKEGYWNGDMPFCLALTCDLLSTPGNGLIVNMTHPLTFGARVQFACNDGYRIDGSPTLNCLEDGSWDDLPPICLPHKCSVVPTIFNGIVAVHETRNTSVASFTCDKGYNLQGPPELVCTDNGFWNIVETQKCVPDNWNTVFCPPPLYDPNTVVININNTDEYTEGSQLHVMCRYKLNVTVARTCQGDGRWDNDMPDCDIGICRVPPSIARGKWTIVKQTEELEELDIFLQNTEIIYECEAGFILDGSSVLYCTPLGIWSSPPPACLPQPVHRCPKPLAPINGRVTIAGGRALFDCSHGFRLEGSTDVVCRTNGTWSKFPQCVTTSVPDDGMTHENDGTSA